MLQESNSLQGDLRCFAPSHSNEHFKAKAETGKTRSYPQPCIHHQYNRHLSQERNKVTNKSLQIKLQKYIIKIYNLGCEAMQTSNLRSQVFFVFINGRLGKAAKLSYCNTPESY